MKVLFDLRVTQAQTRWPDKLIKKNGFTKPCETKQMDWKQQGRGDSPSLSLRKVCRRTDIQDIQFVPQNGKLLFFFLFIWIPFSLYYGLAAFHSDVNGERGGEKRNQREYLAGDLWLLRNVCSAALAEAAAVSILKGLSAQKGWQGRSEGGWTPQNGFTTLVIRSK